MLRGGRQREDRTRAELKRIWLQSLRTTGRKLVCERRRWPWAELRKKRPSRGPRALRWIWSPVNMRDVVVLLSGNKKKPSFSGEHQKQCAATVRARRCMCFTHIILLTFIKTMPMKRSRIQFIIRQPSFLLYSTINGQFGVCCSCKLPPGSAAVY